MGLTSITEKASLEFSWHDKADCKSRIAMGVPYSRIANHSMGAVIARMYEQKILFK